MKYFIMAFKKYATFSGRSRRQEYWMFYLFYMIFAILCSAIDYTLKIKVNDILFTPVTYLLGLASLIPFFALISRRLHDSNKSFAYIFMSLIPLVGSLILFIRLCTDGTPGSNQYGDDPKGRGMSQDTSPSPRVARTGFSPPQNTDFSSSTFNKSPSFDSNSSLNSPPLVSSQELPTAQPGLSEDKPPLIPPLITPTPPKASAFADYFGGGNCDVCSSSLNGQKAFIVPNDIFYTSQKYIQMMDQKYNIARNFGISPQAYFNSAKAKDTSSGSAVCQNCIHLFE